MAPSPGKKNSGLAYPRSEDVYRMMKEVFEVWVTNMDKLLREYKEEWRSMDQRSTRPEYGARQPRLAKEADGPANTKTRERTKGAATAV